MEKITAQNFRNTPDRAKMKRLYRTAFPKEERLPWWVLRGWNWLRWGGIDRLLSGRRILRFCLFCNHTDSALCHVLCCGGWSAWSGVRLRDPYAYGAEGETGAAQCGDP